MQVSVEKTVLCLWQTETYTQLKHILFIKVLNRAKYFFSLRFESTYLVHTVSKSSCLFSKDDYWFCFYRHIFSNQNWEQVRFTQRCVYFFSSELLFLSRTLNRRTSVSPDEHGSGSAFRTECVSQHHVELKTSHLQNHRQKQLFLF